MLTVECSVSLKRFVTMLGKRRGAVSCRVVLCHVIFGEDSDVFKESGRQREKTLRDGILNRRQHRQNCILNYYRYKRGSPGFSGEATLVSVLMVPQF